MANEIDPLRKIINELVDARIEARLKSGPATLEVPAQINVTESLPHYIFIENMPARELSDDNTLGQVFALIYHEKIPERFNMKDVQVALLNVYAHSTGGSLRDTLDELISLRVLEASSSGTHVNYSVRKDFQGRVTLRERKK